MRRARHAARPRDAAYRWVTLTLARRRVLPPEESRHVAGTALDVRPAEGARWLERHGGAHGLYRIYDNEWWHFEYRPEGQPRRLPHAAGHRSAEELAWAG